LATGLREWSPVCVRVPGSAFIDSDELQLPAVITPETAIPDLQDWGHHAVSTNIRRDLKKAAAAGLELVDAKGADDGARLYEIYAATIKRHRGSLRYNARYFSRLIDLASTRQDLRVITARKHGDIAGFLVLVMDTDTAYYLHGGTNFELPNYHSAPLLFETAIEAAKSRGLRCFNFMSSPADQPTLVQYKEKWGGITRQHKTHVLALRPAYHLFKVAEKIYGMIRHAR
jgi:lipid II:glycine glycyltransferase (peptidoglycan interpeptide bridge formation enzyme)